MSGSVSAGRPMRRSMICRQRSCPDMSTSWSRSQKQARAWKMTRDTMKRECACHMMCAGARSVSATSRSVASSTTRASRR